MDRGVVESFEVFNMLKGSVDLDLQSACRPNIQRIFDETHINGLY
jgi:hypothetical protein